MAAPTDTAVDNGDLLPDPERAKRYQASRDRFAVEKLIRATDIVTTAFNMEIESVSEALQTASAQVDRGLKLSPFAHFQCRRLLRAIRDQQPETALSTICDLPLDNLCRHGIRVARLSDRALTDPEKAIIRYIFSHSDEYSSFVDAAVDPVSQYSEQPSDASMADNVETAFRSIDSALPVLGEELRQLFSEVVLLRAPSLISMSFRTCPGLLILNYLKPGKNISSIIESIIHEAAHQYLFLIESQEPLIENRDDRLYYSAIKEKPRPMSGVFHGMVAMARIIWCMSQLWEAGVYRELNVRVIAAGESNFLDAYASLEEVVRKNARLTVTGQRMHGSCNRLVAASRNCAIWKVVR